MNKKPNSNKPDPEDDKKRQERMRHQMNFSLGYLVVGLIGLWLFQQFVLAPLAVRETEIPYSEFKAKIQSGQIIDVTIGDSRIIGDMKNTSDSAGSSSASVPFTTIAVPNGDPTLIEELDKAKITYKVSPPPSPIGNFLLAYVLPLALIGGAWYFLYSRMSRGGIGGGGGAGGIFGVGKSKATEVKPEEIGVNYKDVGGADEAIAELQEIIQFLKSPEKFARLGGRIPKGVLLVGPPGTGKTLLAKATAGEAEVPFFETSGSEFVEMFVGVGAARVRDLFENARKVAPAVVFIDEIDAIGQSRANAVQFGSNDEREQTLNQLLAEIDGFSTNITKPVIIMAATNRPEVLDPALLRAGRFDRQVAVGNPDLTGRIQILKIHSKNVRLASDFNVERAARITPGFSGADLANVINEAALLAARRNAQAVEMIDFEAAIERIVAGLEKRTRVMNEVERNTVAYHEIGHALVAQLMDHAEPVAKISIVPRSRGALGYTLQMPTEDRYLMTREELTDRIAVMLGGRAAEKVVLGTISTGASDDINRATELAHRMVAEFGMSDRLGSVRYAGQQLQYLNGAVRDNAQISPETQQLIDKEIQRIITEQYDRAQQLLTEHLPIVHQLAQKLLEKENLDGSEVRKALGEPELEPHQPFPV
jgi:cell division protease FtsH